MSDKETAENETSRPRALKEMLLGRNREERVWTAFLTLLFLACLVFISLTGGDWAKAMTERLEAGKTLKLEQFIHTGLWWAALIAGTMALTLCLSRKFWYFESEKPQKNTNEATKGTNRLQWYAWIFLILVTAVFVRWPRMDLSLYNDEADVYIRYIDGSFKGAAWDLKTEQLPKYQQKGWDSTFWGNKQGNNHVLFSALARACYTVDRWITGRVPGEIHELPLRLPALAGGLLSILMVAMILKQLGRSQAGIFAAAFLAMHPWHVRFSTEARGYGLLFGLMMLAIYFLIRGLKEKQWKWWMAYALFQCLYLYSCLAGVYHALAINAAVACFWMLGEWGRVGGLTRIRQWDRRTFKALVVSNGVSLIFFLLLMGPSIPQISRATKTIGIFKLGMPSGLWPDVMSYLAFGMSWFDGDPDNPWNPAVEKWLPGGFMVLGIVIVSLLVLLGIRAWWKTGAEGRMVLAGAGGSVLLVFVLNSLNGGTVLSWYLSYLTPVAAMTLGLGLAELLRFRSQAGGGKVVLRNRIILYAVIALYAAVVMKPLKRYRTIGKQAMRDTIELVRGGVYPFSEEQRVPITAGWWTNADVYDPYMKIAYNKVQIGFLMDKADREKRPFYFVLANYPSAEAEDASVLELLEKSGEFKLVRVFPGLETYQYREFVFLYRGGGRNK